MFPAPYRRVPVGSRGILVGDTHPYMHVVTIGTIAALGAEAVCGVSTFADYFFCHTFINHANSCEMEKLAQIRATIFCEEREKTYLARRRFCSQWK